MTDTALKPCPDGVFCFETHNRTPSIVQMDIDDAPIAEAYKWRKYPSCRYVQAYARGGTIAIHRVIMNAPSGMSVDHINGNTCDNRKVNLRICSHAQNSKNRRPNKNGKSSYKGVVILPNGRFRSKINADGVRFELGVYDTERDAAIAHNAAAKVLHGEFAYMGEIPPYPTEDAAFQAGVEAGLERAARIASANGERWIRRGGYCERSSAADIIRNAIRLVNPTTVGRNP